jgi:hypothetical protein
MHKINKPRSVAPRGFGVSRKEPLVLPGNDCESSQIEEVRRELHTYSHVI